MRQDVLTHGRSRLLLRKGHSAADQGGLEKERADPWGGCQP